MNPETLQPNNERYHHTDLRRFILFSALLGVTASLHAEQRLLLLAGSQSH